MLRDRSFVEQMKSDILRRVEAPSDSEDEETTNIFGVVAGKRKVREVAFDDELDDVGSVRVAGDGEDSSVNENEDEDGREEDSEESEMTPQMIVELAYVANPKVFERDAATRRSKERAALRAQTGASPHWRPSHEICALADPLFKGWVDEQIEGFRIMLDRDVRSTSSLSIHLNLECTPHVPNLFFFFDLS
jgi:activating signal cointegrator complex subunit 2